MLYPYHLSSVRFPCAPVNSDFFISVCVSWSNWRTKTSDYFSYYRAICNNLDDWDGRNLLVFFADTDQTIPPISIDYCTWQGQQRSFTTNQPKKCHLRSTLLCHFSRLSNRAPSRLSHNFGFAQKTPSLVPNWYCAAPYQFHRFLLHAGTIILLTTAVRFVLDTTTDDQSRELFNTRWPSQLCFPRTETSSRR